MPVRRDPRIRFAVTLARALHRYGTPTHRLEETMNSVLRRLGLEGAFFSIPTGVFASFGSPEEHRTSLIRTETTETNLEKLSDLDELAEEVIRGDLDATTGTARVGAIMATPSRYPPLLALIAMALSSATAARFFGGGWREIVVAAAIGVIVGFVETGLGRSEGARRILPIVAAIIASAGATAAGHIVHPFSIYVAMLAGVAILLPGMQITTAMTELATGNLVSGSARLTGSALVLLELGFGVAVGSQIARLLPADTAPMHFLDWVLGAPVAQLLPPLPAITTPMRLPEWTVYAALILAPMAFTVLLRARPRDLGWIATACALAFGGSRLGRYMMGPELGALIGTVALGLGGNLFARFTGRPSSVAIVPGLIILVPGSIGFSSLSNFIAKDVLSGAQAAFTVVLVAMALVTGLLIANVIVPPKKSL